MVLISKPRLLRPSIRRPSPLRLSTSPRSQSRQYQAPYQLAHHYTTLPSPSPKSTVLIVGAGLSGLSSAFFLLRSLTPELRRETKVIILEKANRSGGWCRSVEVPLKEMGLERAGRAVLETGVRSVRPVGLQGWLTIEMAHSIGLTSSLLTVPKTAPSAKNRYLFYPSSLRLLPSSLLSSLTSAFTNPVIRSSIPGILLEPFRPRSTSADESIDSFFTRRFGRPLAENMISAMIHGIYSGDTRRLSLKAVFPGLWDAERRSGSVIRSMLSRKKGDKSDYQKEMEMEEKEMEIIKERLRGTVGGGELVQRMEGASVWGVKGGLEKLTQGIQKYLEEKEGVKVVMGTDCSVALDPTSGSFSVQTPQETYHPTHFISTNPTLLTSTFDAPPIPSATVSVINLCFLIDPTKPLFPPGFGYLIPRTVSKEKNPHHVLGVIFDSDVMPGVDDTNDLPVEEGKLVKITLILGGSYWLPPSSLKPSPFPPSHETLLQYALTTLKLHFPTTSFPSPIYSHSSTHFNCLAQVPPGYGEEFKKLDEKMKEASQKSGVKLAVVGGGTGGVGVNGAVKAAWEVGESFAKNIEGEAEAKTGLEVWIK